MVDCHSLTYEVTTSSDMHINNITGLTLNDSVRRKVEETGFGFLVKLHEMLPKKKGLLLPLNFVNSLVSNYNAEADCFKIRNGANEFDLDFGLEDILYITGLPNQWDAGDGNNTARCCPNLVNTFSYGKN
ncbi:hypothetical protein L195_g041333 [Trifolium pratense]|uniref:Uncharacterized protein n=1 Tax=Trifolium pratense TaxID=57577 RepID=A0A2K3M393_TRIPR|nr:hypothetical protein L195_g041333 [Trifolium pratense]